MAGRPPNRSACSCCTWATIWPIAVTVVIANTARKTPTSDRTTRLLCTRTSSHASAKAPSRPVMRCPVRCCGVEGAGLHQWRQPTALEPVPPGRQRRHRQVVGDRDQRRPGLRRRPVQQRHHLRTGLDVQGAGGLVGEHDAGTADQRPGDRDPLLLAAGEPLRHLVRAGAEAHQVEHLGGGATPAQVAPAAGVQQRRGHVLDRRPPRQQVELLEHEAEDLAAQPRPPPGPEMVGGLAVEEVDARTSGVSSRPSRFSRVDLPDPDRPTIETCSPARHLEVDAGQDRQDATRPAAAPRG